MSVKLILLAIVLFSTTLYGVTSTPLTIQNIKNGKKISLSPEGTLDSDMPLQDKSNTNLLGGLTFTRVGHEATVAIASDKTTVKKDIAKNNLTTGRDDNFLITNEAVSLPDNTSQGILTKEGDLLLAGVTDGGYSVTTSTAYLTTGVYEDKGTGYEYQYTTIGAEGRTLKDGEVEFFIKDHLGSTRKVINESGDVTEILAYKPYGEQLTIQKSSSIKNRDNFTGKELDTEGEVGTLLFDITVSGFTDLTTKSYASSLELHFTDGTTEKHTLDQWAPGFDKLVHKKMITYNEEKNLDKAELSVNVDGTTYNGVTTFNGTVKTTLGNKSVISLTKDKDDLNNSFLASTPVEGIYYGIKLNYFGARYYDAEVGLWTSTDPAEQFYGLYTYSGSGYNPINAIDGDGKDMYIVSEDDIGGHQYVIVQGIGANKDLWFSYDFNPKDFPQIWYSDGSFDYLGGVTDPSKLVREGFIATKIHTSQKQDNAAHVKALDLKEKNVKFKFIGYNCRQFTKEVINAKEMIFDVPALTPNPAAKLAMQKERAELQREIQQNKKRSNTPNVINKIKDE